VRQLGGLTGGSGTGRGTAAAAVRLSAAERQQVEAAIEQAFTQGSGGRLVVGAGARERHGG
jgi:2-methylcitrate dehydratase PrpD